MLANAKKHYEEGETPEEAYVEYKIMKQADICMELNYFLLKRSNFQ